MGLIAECEMAFFAFSSFYFCLPVAVRLCIRAAVGCSFLLACFKLFTR